MLKAYKFRLCPTRGQEDKLNWTLNRCRELYNAGLENRITAYKKAGVSINYHTQAVSLPELKEALPEYNDVHSQVLQDVLKRLDKAYQAFFRRVKQGAKAGFPRFQGKYRFDSFTYPQYKQTPTKHVYLPKIGNVRIKLSRQIEGKIKTCMVKQEADGWYVVFACEVQPKPLPATGNTIGIDMGLTDIVATSDGELIAAPKYFSKAQKALAKAQRRLARRKKGSNGREWARQQVAKVHQKVARQRDNFLHKLSTRLIRENDTIVHENLNITGMASGMLAKSVHDVSWGKLIHMLSYKAEYAGRQLIGVNPNFTSQDCNVCGHREKHPLWVREFECTCCGMKHHRDINAALNIKSKWVRIEPSCANVDVVESCVARESPQL